jgi:hypothetical protein
LSERIRPPLRHQPVKGGADLGAEQRVVHPALGLVDVEVGRHDIVIAGQHDRDVLREEARGVFPEPLKPAQLIVELRPRGGIAVRQIKAANQDSGDIGLEITTLAVIRVAGQPAPGLLRLSTARQDGDTVPALLAVPDRTIAGLTDRRLRKLLLRRLQLLQANDVRLSPREPAQQHGQAPVHAVDVVGGDSHAAKPRIMLSVLQGVRWCYGPGRPTSEEGRPLGIEPGALPSFHDRRGIHPACATYHLPPGVKWRARLACDADGKEYSRTTKGRKR